MNAWDQAGETQLNSYRGKWSEFNNGDKSDQYEGYQHDGLRDREGGLRLGRRQCIQGRNLHEALRYENKNVEVERYDCSDHVNPTPCAYQALFV